MYDKDKKVRYSGLKTDDVANGEGFVVSFWTQGCPFHCEGCHNPQTWDFHGGETIKYGELLTKILSLLCEDDIERNFSILGGEPLCSKNLMLVYSILFRVRERYPDIKIYLWTGYTLEELLDSSNKSNMDNVTIRSILSYIDVLIDGRYDESLRNTRLELRGSENQRVLYKGKDF